MPGKTGNARVVPCGQTVTQQGIVAGRRCHDDEQLLYAWRRSDLRCYRCKAVTCAEWTTMMLVFARVAVAAAADDDAAVGLCFI